MKRLLIIAAILSAPFLLAARVGNVTFLDLVGCLDSGGNHLNYNASTGAITCGNTGAGGSTPGGAAGGDLSGTYPNPTVAKVNGDTNVAFLDVAQSFTKPQRTSTGTPAISTTTFTPVFSADQNYRIVFPATTCTCTIANPAALVAGQNGVFELVQGATSASANPAWGSEYQFAGGTSTITLTTTLGGVDYIGYHVDSTGSFIVLTGVSSHPTH